MPTATRTPVEVPPEVTHDPKYDDVVRALNAVRDAVERDNPDDLFSASQRLEELAYDLRPNRGC